MAEDPNAPRTADSYTPKRITPAAACAGTLMDRDGRLPDQVQTLARG